MQSLAIVESLPQAVIVKLVVNSLYVRMLTDPLEVDKVNMEAKSEYIIEIE